MNRDEVKRLTEIREERKDIGWLEITQYWANMEGKRVIWVTVKCPACGAQTAFTSGHDTCQFCRQHIT